MSARLTSRVAIITGGGNGIGKETVSLFLAQGARVAVWDVEPDAERELAELFPEHAESLFVTKLDIRDKEAVDQAARAVLSRWNRIDILVNSAGLTMGRFDMCKYDSREWRLPIDVHMLGTLQCVAAVIPTMMERSWGRIITTSSLAPHVAYPGSTAYSASKAGLEAMTRVWAREFGRHKITANVVRPGFIATRINKGQGPDFIRMVEQRTALGRIGQPEDVAKVHLFLASDEAEFVTGAVIPVDGGLVL